MKQKNRVERIKRGDTVLWRFMKFRPTKKREKTPLPSREQILTPPTQWPKGRGKMPENSQRGCGGARTGSWEWKMVQLPWKTVGQHHYSWTCSTTRQKCTETQIQWGSWQHCFLFFFLEEPKSWNCRRPSRACSWELNKKESHVHPWLMHANVWQKSPQYCKVISLQLKFLKNKNNSDQKKKESSVATAQTSHPVNKTRH